jgi:glycosyltransferase involved in cell wall biosynthesis
LLRERRVDLVHLNNSILRNHPWIIAALVAGIPCITHERGLSRHFDLRSRLTSRALDAVICISSAVRNNLVTRGLGWLPIVTIHNGLDPEEMRVTQSTNAIRAEHGIPEHARLIGMVGNIKPWKGQEVLVRAVALLRDAFPDLVCLLVGDSAPAEREFRNQVAQLINELDLSGRVLVTGYRDDVANYVNALEIQVHASIAPEPFGRVLLEAMALGKPLVASNSGGVPEIVVDGVTGLLFEPGNVDALASCLKTLLAQPALATECGRAGRCRLDSEFSIRRNVEQTEALYRQFLS